MISEKMGYTPKANNSLLAEEALVDYAPEEAQAWCNFVLFQMTYLPQEFTIAKQQVQREYLTSLC